MNCPTIKYVLLLNHYSLTISRASAINDKADMAFNGTTIN